MTYEQQPQYPGQQPQYPGPDAYQPYPGAAQPYPGVAPVPPPPVMYAFYLMLAGAVLTVLGTLFSFTQLDAARESAKRASDDVLSEDQLDTIVTISFWGGVVVALISVGLWIWMAFANRSGKNWARITATVFFGLYSVSMIAAVVTLFLPESEDSIVATIVNVLVWLIGLAATILLWNRQSGAYFKPAPSYPQCPGTYPPYTGQPGV